MVEVSPVEAGPGALGCITLYFLSWIFQGSSVALALSQRNSLAFWCEG